jgi:hypothetical protein
MGVICCMRARIRVLKPLRVGRCGGLLATGHLDGTAEALLILSRVRAVEGPKFRLQSGA